MRASSASERPATSIVSHCPPASSSARHARLRSMRTSAPTTSPPPEPERDDDLGPRQPGRAGVGQLRLPERGEIGRAADQRDQQAHEHDAVQRLHPAPHERDDRRHRRDPHRDRHEAAPEELECLRDVRSGSGDLVRDRVRHVGDDDHRDEHGEQPPPTRQHRGHDAEREQHRDRRYPRQPARTRHPVERRPRSATRSSPRRNTMFCWER